MKIQEPLNLIVYTKIIHNNILIKLLSGYDLKTRDLLSILFFCKLQIMWIMIYDYINGALLLTCTQNMRGILYIIWFFRKPFISRPSPVWSVKTFWVETPGVGTYICMHTQLFPVSKTDGLQKFEHARPKTISKNARPFSSHARTQFMLHTYATALLGIINATRKGIVSVVLTETC